MPVPKTGGYLSRPIGTIPSQLGYGAYSSGKDPYQEGGAKRRRKTNWSTRKRKKTTSELAGTVRRRKRENIHQKYSRYILHGKNAGQLRQEYARPSTRKQTGGFWGAAARTALELAPVLLTAITQRGNGQRGGGKVSKLTKSMFGKVKTAFRDPRVKAVTANLLEKGISKGIHKIGGLAMKQKHLSKILTPSLVDKAAKMGSKKATKMLMNKLASQTGSGFEEFFTGLGSSFLSLFK
ncbi:MAG: hypothetical protein V6Z82_00975 [Flavobacteriales bacterium]